MTCWVTVSLSILISTGTLSVSRIDIPFLLKTEIAPVSILLTVDPKHSEERQINDIIRLIEKCPSWCHFRRNNKRMSRKILAQLDRISNYDSYLIRKAVDKYSRQQLTSLSRGNDVACRIYVLNRFIFAVPEDTPFEGRRFGGWTGRPESGGRINWLWPFSYDSYGRIELTYEYEGYMGHTYLALDEFDYFFRKFGRRKASVEK